jgi:phosphatidylglycerophosphate synthase
MNVKSIMNTPNTLTLIFMGVLTCAVLIICAAVLSMKHDINRIWKVSSATDTAIEVRSLNARHAAELDAEEGFCAARQAGTALSVTRP